MPNIAEKINQINNNIVNGKTAIANAITEKGVITEAADSFNIMAENIKNIKNAETTTENKTFVDSELIIPNTIEGRTQSLEIYGDIESVNSLAENNDNLIVLESVEPLTTGVILACVALASACGIVITNPDMLEDIGTRVYEGIKDIPNVIENLGDNIKFNITKDLLSTVVDICNTLPVDDFIKEVVETIPHNGVYFGEKTIKSIFGGHVNSGVITLSCASDPYNWGYVPLKICVGSEFLGFKIPTGEVWNIGFTVHTDGYVYVDLLKLGTFKVPYTYDFMTNENRVFYITLDGYFPGSYRIGDLENKKSVCIPYTEKNTENVSSDKPLVYFPTGSGSISVPSDAPIGGFNPSVDSPITSPNDLVGEGSINADSVSYKIILVSTNKENTLQDTLEILLDEPLRSATDGLIRDRIYQDEVGVKLERKVGEDLLPLSESTITTLESITDLSLRTYNGYTKVTSTQNSLKNIVSVETAISIIAEMEDDLAEYLKGKQKMLDVILGKVPSLEGVLTINSPMSDYSYYMLMIGPLNFKIYDTISSRTLKIKNCMPMTLQSITESIKNNIMEEDVSSVTQVISPITLTLSNSMVINMNNITCVPSTTLETK